METNEKSPSAKELLRRIQELEAHHAVIKQQISAMKLTVNPYLSILQSMGQSVFIYDVNHRIIFWNQGAENLYGYTVSEVMGRIPTDVLAEAKDASVSEVILERTVNGESWCGQFPIKNKSGESFVVVCSNTPFRDENGVSIGAMCVSTDSRPFQLTSSTALKALKVKSNMKIGLEKFTYHDNHSVNVFQSTPRGPFGVFFSSDIDTEEHYRIKHALMMASGDGSENKPGIRRHLSLKEKENKKEIVSFDTRQRVSSAPAKLDYRNKIQAIGLKWLSRLHVNSTSMDDEILWENLTIKQQIGRGSCGTVYHGLWHGSDVAVKVFAYQEFSNDVMLTFRQEVSLMKRLRHPNILLFMGAVTSSPQHLCIVTEFLPRGSLFQILRRNLTRLDWKRRLQMAIDIARGMNYLHRCNPPIVHRDLKSSNLLVDKCWTVKVGDFGLSRIKHQTYLKTKSGKGTPQWMAPEIIRNEQANEKSDVYSYGVVLWEIVTDKVPWDDLNPMQVIAAVGFMNERLDIPKEVDPQWTSLIKSCWCSDPQGRPTFQEILYKLKDLKQKFAVECRR